MGSGASLLHWLPIEWGIRFKFASLVYKVLNTGHLPHLTDLLQQTVKRYSSSCTHLRATGCHLSYGITQCYLPPDAGERAQPNNITSLQGPRVHLSVTYFLFRNTTFHLALALFTSQGPKYVTLYLFTSANPKHTLPSDAILRLTTLSQPILPPSGPRNVP